MRAGVQACCTLPLLQTAKEITDSFRGVTSSPRQS